MTIFEYFLGAVLGSLPEYFLIISGVFFETSENSKNSICLVFSEYFSGTSENSRNSIFWSIFEEFSILHNLAELPSCNPIPTNVKIISNHINKMVTLLTKIGSHEIDRNPATVTGHIIGNLM